MEAQVWTIIGVLTWSLVILFHLERRIDRSNARIDGLGAHLDSRIDRIHSRVDRFETRMEILEDQGRELADAIYSAAQTLDNHLRRHAS